MISNSIKQFRKQREMKSRVSSDTRAKTKQRIGLAQRQIADTSYKVEQEGRAQQASIEEAKGPGEKVNAWVDEIDALKAERAEKSKATDGSLSLGSYSSTGQEPTVRPQSQILNKGEEGRLAAENYLGKPIEQTDWEMLVRATYAESTSDPEEQAAVMSVMLNRVKSKGYPDSVKGVLNQRNQFQAVTGTANDPGPSSMFTSFGDKNMAAFESKSAPLLNNFLKQNWLNFTANNKAAYGPGTDVNFIKDVSKAQGSMVIGGTVFGTVGKK